MIIYLVIMFQLKVSGNDKFLSYHAVYMKDLGMILNLGYLLFTDLSEIMN